MPGIPALRRLRQEDEEFEASLGDTGRLCLRKKKNLLKDPFLLILSLLQQYSIFSKRNP
jgi:hypothetical protein